MLANSFAAIRPWEVGSDVANECRCDLCVRCARSEKSDIMHCLPSRREFGTMWQVINYFVRNTMASKKGNRIIIKMRSTESAHTYTTVKNRKNDPSRLELRRYDPTVRKHVAYRETK